MKTIASQAGLLLLLSMLGVAYAQPVEEEHHLLFEANFEAAGDIHPYFEIPGPDRQIRMQQHLMSQGEGAMSGELKGKLSFSLLGRKAPEKDSIFTHLVGWLETKDGAEIMYQASGYARETTSGKAAIKITATIKFPTSDRPYEYLEEISGQLIGEYHMTSGIGSWKVYLPKQTQK